MNYVDDAFQTMKSNLEITATEQQQASKRHTAIRDHLRSLYDLDTDFLTGSYKRDTKTKRLKDVDIFIVFADGGADAGKRQLTPDAMLNDLQSALSPKYDSVSVGLRACTIAFGSGDDVASFDVVPAFTHLDGGYEIPDRVSGAWVRTDPTVHAAKATAKNKACDGKWKPLVKMIKGWNREAGKPIRPSFLLEVMALDLVTEPVGRYQDEIRWFFATAADRIADSWPDPASLGPDVNSLMSASDKSVARDALLAARTVAEDAIRLEDAGSMNAAVDKWKELFGRRMPKP